MGRVIMFKGRDQETKFIESLNEWQLEIFLDIITKAKTEYEQLHEEYEQKDIECLALKAELRIYRGEL